MAHCMCDVRNCTNRIFMDGDDIVITWDTEQGIMERRITLPTPGPWTAEFTALIKRLDTWQDS